jgi:hypothetical protein
MALDYESASGDPEKQSESKSEDLAGGLGPREKILKKPGDDFLLGKPNMTDAENQRYEQLEALLNPGAENDAELPGPPPSRRWHTGWGRKRRWKS